MLYQQGILALRVTIHEFLTASTSQYVRRLTVLLLVLYSNSQLLQPSWHLLRFQNGLYHTFE